MTTRTPSPGARRPLAVPLAVPLVLAATLVAATLGACDRVALRDGPAQRTRDDAASTAPATAPSSTATAAAPRSTTTPLAPGAPWDPASTHAVILGVLSFADPAITPFSAIHRKDQELADTLAARGVARERITVLLDHQATSDAMLAAVEAQARSAAPGSTLLVYYAGHGTRTDDGEIGFLAWDAQPRSAFSVRALGRVLAASFRGARVLLLADCCHSGGLAETAAHLESNGLRAAAITSADASNTSTVNWTFTQSIIDALRGDPLADRDGDGSVRLGELAAEVKDAMKHRERQRAGVALGSLDPDVVMAPRAGAPAPAPTVPGPAVGSWLEARRDAAFVPARVVARPDAARATVELYDYSDKSRLDVRLDATRPLVFHRHPAGAKVRVTWGGKVWDADVVAVEGDFHHVTYPGWSSSWDEWVASDRIVGTR